MLMDSDQAWMSSLHLQHVIASGDAAGFDMDSVLAAVGKTRAMVQQAPGRIPVSLMEALLEKTAYMQHEPHIGFRLAVQLRPGTFGALGLLVQTCPTLGDILETMVRFNGLLSNFGESALCYHPGYVEFHWRCKAGSPRFQRLATEYVLCAVAAQATQLTARPQGLVLALGFPFQPPAWGSPESGPIASHFSCAVYYAEPKAYIRFPTAALALPIPHGDQELRNLLEAHVRRVWQQLTAEGADSTVCWSERVVNAIRQMGLRPPPSRELIAELLGLSARHLHRKLHEEGLSFQQLLDRVRLGQAKAALRQGRVTVLQAARQLGFASHTGFVRWFKQHSGLTPGAFRDQTRPGAPACQQALKTSAAEL